MVEINLSNNEIVNVPYTWFNTSTVLETITLDENPIASKLVWSNIDLIDICELPSLVHDTFQDTLEFIRLSNLIGIDRIDFNCFKAFPKLLEINVVNNNLEQIYNLEGMFYEIYFIHQFRYLHSNQIFHSYVIISVIY